MTFYKKALPLALAALFGSNLIAGAPAASSKMVNMPPAAAGKSGFYIGALGSLVWMQDEHPTLPDGASITTHFDTTWGVSVPIGYRWSNGWQVEFLGGYYNIELSSQDERYPAGYFGRGSKAENRNNLPVEASGCWVPLTLNTSYRFFRDKPLSFYVGIGAGAIYNQSELSRIGEFELDVEGSQWDPVGQVFAGVSYAVTSHVDFNLGYRFVRQFDRGAADSKLHLLETGLIYRF